MEVRDYLPGHIAKKNKNEWAYVSDSPVGQNEPAAHPKNCRTECPYGKNRAFCFPCMKKIMSERKAATTSQEA